MEESRGAKLHEAMEKILIKSDVSLSTTEIADEINASGLYRRKDGLPVPRSQILARAINYTSRFNIVEEIISLKNHL